MSIPNLKQHDMFSNQECWEIYLALKTDSGTVRAFVSTNTGFAISIVTLKLMTGGLLINLSRIQNVASRFTRVGQKIATSVEFYFLKAFIL